MTPRLEEFTPRQIKAALKAIQNQLNIVEYLEDEDVIAAGKCEFWDDLTLFKVQLLMALERSEKVDKTWSN